MIIMYRYSVYKLIGYHFSIVNYFNQINASYWLASSVGDMELFVYWSTSLSHNHTTNKWQYWKNLNSVN